MKIYLESNDTFVPIGGSATIFTLPNQSYSDLQFSLLDKASIDLSYLSQPVILVSQIKVSGQSSDYHFEINLDTGTVNMIDSSGNRIANIPVITDEYSTTRTCEISFSDKQTPVFVTENNGVYSAGINNTNPNSAIGVEKTTTDSLGDLVKGAAGDDTLHGFIGADTLRGFAGDDLMDGGFGNDLIEGENGKDTLLGGEGDDILLAGSDNDSLEGGVGNDSLEGGMGYDYLNGGQGIDTMKGGDGNDYYVIESESDLVEELDGSSSGKDTVECSLDAYILPINFENLILTGIGNKNGIGNESDNEITGNESDNVLKGLEGNDKLIGGTGADELDGGLGMDTLIGGDGDDKYIINNENDEIVEKSGGGNHDKVIAGVDYDLGRSENVEDLELTGKAKNGTGNDLDNQITQTGTENVTLNGGKGNDTLIGGLGDDTLQGDEGDDVIDGGIGHNVAIFNDASNNYVLRRNIDTKGVAQIAVKHRPDNGVANEGDDILSNIQELWFSDGTKINESDVKTLIPSPVETTVSSTQALIIEINGISPQPLG